MYITGGELPPLPDLSSLPLPNQLPVCPSINRHATKLSREGGPYGLPGAAGRAMCFARVGAAVRAAVSAAPALAAACEENSAHVVVETMTQVSEGC